MQDLTLFILSTTVYYLTITISYLNGQLHTIVPNFKIVIPFYFFLAFLLIEVYAFYNIEWRRISKTIYAMQIEKKMFTITSLTNDKKKLVSHTRDDATKTFKLYFTRIYKYAELSLKIKELYGCK